LTALSRVLRLSALQYKETLSQYLKALLDITADGLKLGIVTVLLRNGLRALAQRIDSWQIRRRSQLIFQLSQLSKDAPSILIALGFLRFLEKSISQLGQPRLRRVQR
jgi:hypothetical protein